MEVVFLRFLNLIKAIAPFKVGDLAPVFHFLFRGIAKVGLGEYAVEGFGDQFQLVGAHTEGVNIAVILDQVQGGRGGGFEAERHSFGHYTVDPDDAFGFLAQLFAPEGERLLGQDAEQPPEGCRTEGAAQNGPAEIAGGDADDDEKEGAEQEGDGGKLLLAAVTVHTVPQWLQARMGEEAGVGWHG